MAFKQTTPKSSTKLQSISMVIRALVYLNIKSDSGSFTGGLMWKFIRPVIFSFLFAMFITLIRGSNDLLYSFQLFYLPFVFYFFIADLILNAGNLAGKDNLLNLPRVNHLVLIFASPLSQLIMFIPQAIIAICIYVYLLREIDWFLFLQIFFLSSFFGTFFYCLMSLLLYQSPFLNQIYQLATRPLIFISAVFYPVEILSQQFRHYILYNPIVSIMEFCRKFAQYDGEIFTANLLLISFIVFCIIAFPVAYFLRVNIFHFGQKRD